MNQSDIRGLVRHQRTRANIDILRREILPSTFVSSAEQFCLSHRGDAYCSYRACTRQYQPFIQFSNSKKSGFGGWVTKKLLILHATFLLFLISYSLNTDHINPANSLAIATVALHGIFPLLTRYQYRFRSRCPALSAMSITHCG